MQVVQDKLEQHVTHFNVNQSNNPEFNQCSARVSDTHYDCRYWLCETFHHLLQMVGFLFYTAWHFSTSNADGGISVSHCVTLLIICSRWWDFCFTLCDTFDHLQQMMGFLFYTVRHIWSSAADDGISVLHRMTLLIICCRFFLSLALEICHLAWFF